jgi:PAS domain S-box-containing protein
LFYNLRNTAVGWNTGRYGIAAVAALFALQVRLALQPVLGSHTPYLPSLLSVILSARYCGRGPGLIATIVSALGTAYLFLEPIDSFAVAGREAAAGLGLFVAVAIVISMWLGGLRESLLSTSRAELALRESETQFRTLANAIPQLCWIANEEGWLFWYNQRWYEYTGTTPEQMEGWGWVSVHDPAELPSVMERWKVSLSTGQPFEMVFPLRGADGVFRPFLTRIRPVKNGEGKITRWFGTNTDISEQQKTEEALRASEARYSLLAEALPAVIFTASPQGLTDYVNRRWLEYTGLTVEEALASGWASVVHQEDSEKTRSVWMAALESGSPFETELRLRKADGSYRWFLSQATPLRNEKGEILKWLGIATDIEDDRRSEERLRQSQKLEAIGRLAGGVAHDFNNLLTAISGYNALVMERLSDPTMLAYAQEVNGAANRAAALTQQLLAFSRRQVAQTKPVNLNDVILEMRNLLTRVIGEDIELITSFSEKQAIVRADPVQVDQVIMNLAVNARDAMPSGGRLHFETASISLSSAQAGELQLAPGDYVTLTATDNGVGMDGVTKNRLFEPFFTTKDRGKGTGLGLSIIYGVVRQSSGAIVVDSEPGAGASFKIYFPKCSETESDSTASPAVAPKTATAFATLLLVEDDATVRRFVGAVLRNHGYEIIEASTPNTALEHVQRHPGPIDLLLTDVLMPEMRGPELADRLRDKYRELRVVFMSGYSDSTFLDPKALTNADYIQKPFSAEQLIRQIQNALSKGN